MDWTNIIITGVLGFTGVVITVLFNRRAQKLANDKLFKELFTEFTARYGLLNGKLQEVQNKYPDSLIQGSEEDLEERLSLTDDVMDFFNLCAEEYYWAQVKRRIDGPVWRTWMVGMDFWVNQVPSIRELWEKEMQMANWQEAYYIKQKDVLFRLK